MAGPSQGFKYRPSRNVKILQPSDTIPPRRISEMKMECVSTSSRYVSIRFRFRAVKVDTRPDDLGTLNLFAKNDFQKPKTLV